MGKKVKVWGKIKLWETSCCGIPIYPYAHKSQDSFSLIKALRETAEPSDELNLGEKPMDETEKSEEKSEEKTEESGEAEAEKTEEATGEEEAEKSEEPAEKSVAVKEVVDMMAKAFKQAIAESKVERGLIAQEVEMKEELSKKSLGELAMMNGLFKSDPDPVSLQPQG